MARLFYFLVNFNSLSYSLIYLFFYSFVYSEDKLSHNLFEDEITGPKRLTESEYTGIILSLFDVQ